MSKIVYICLRKYQPNQSLKKSLSAISSEVLPDNIVPAAPHIWESDGITIGIYNPTKTVATRNCSVCMGNMIGGKDWHRPGTAAPDGTYALFRGSKESVEIITDAVASRTIWYFTDNDFFIAATSQRAIIALLGDFEFNESIIPWVLSTGTLGPSGSWDRRIQRLDGDSVVVLNRTTWVLKKHNNMPPFSTSSSGNYQTHKSLLLNALEESFGKMRFDLSEWALPLSGGYDSRAILCLLKEKENLRTITWGLKSSLNNLMNDACIARELAEHFNLPHVYYQTDMTTESVAKVFNRFLICGEGRVDHLPGYMDGFAIWKTLFEDGVCGIIRGDEGFGWAPVYSPLDLRAGLGIPLWSDFSNLKDLTEFGFSEQVIPQCYLQREGESLETWRDRLYHTIRLPVILAALNDLKLPFLEIVNPLLTRRIIYTVRGLPDNLRTGKALFKSIVRSLSPNIRYAKYPAITNAESSLRTKVVVDFLKEELSSSLSISVLPKTFITYVLDRMTLSDTPKVKKARWPSSLGKFSSVVSRLMHRKSIHNITKPTMDFNALAFRSFIICKINSLFSRDIGARITKS